MASNDARFRVLDAWRGLAALFVVAYHFMWFFNISLGKFVYDSYLFVDFFFVLSGFVISHAYLDRLGAPGEPARFVIRRFGRVWPLQIVTLAAAVAALMWVRRPPEWTLWTSEGINPILTNIFLVHSLGLHPGLTLNVPSWSISVEFFTYLVFLALVLWARRFMDWIAVALIGASIALLWAFAERYMDTHHDLGILRCFAGFFAGYLVYRGYSRWGGVGQAWAATLLELAVVVGTFWFVSIAGNGTSPIALAAPAIFAAVVWIYAAEGGALSRVLRLRPFVFLGEISYSIYMTHYIIVLLYPGMLVWAARLTGQPIRINSLAIAPGGPVTSLRIAAVVVAYFALIIAVSVLTYYLIEQPGRRFFVRLSDRAGRTRDVVTPKPDRASA